MKKIYFLLYASFCTISCLAGFRNGTPTTKEFVFDYDAQVVIIYSLSQIPILASGNQDNVKTLIKNTGEQTLTNIPVHFNVTGINNYTDTKIILSLAPDSSVLVGFSYGVSAIGMNILTVSLPYDDNNMNNNLSVTQENTIGLYSYADNAAENGSFGYGAGSGLILARYNHFSTDKVTGVRAHISNDPENIGKTVYAVVLNPTAASIISQSADVVLTATDLGKYMFFPVSPNPFNSGNNVWVGLAQTTGATSYYPISTQAEIPTRTGAYYTRALTGGSTTLMQDSSHGRYMIQAIMNNAVIPVLLESFTAKRNGTVNELAWVTSQEINSKEFILERSNDGISFNTIGHVNAAGNSNTVLHYHFTDNSPIKGMNYYRLRSVDMDAEFKLSEIRTVKNFADADMVVYPNPVKDIINIEVNTITADKGELTVTDIMGKKIYTQSLNIHAGNSDVKINSANMQPGIYILQLKLSRDKLVRQFIKMQRP